jgi:hypothetical protein
MPPTKKRRNASQHATGRASSFRDPRIVGSAVVKGVALGMAVAAEPAWISGEWIALVGSIAMMFIATGSTPADVAKTVRGLVR